MAKKKTKKMNMTKLIVTIVVIALAILTICTLFMPVFTSVVDSILGSTSSSINGADAITACFHGEVSSDLNSGANALITMKASEDAGFVTTVFCWSYFLAVLVSGAVLVFAVLSLVGLRFKLVNTILGIALVLLALVAFIFGFVVASKFGSVELGSLVSGKTSASIGSWLMLAGMVTGVANVYNATA